MTDEIKELYGNRLRVRVCGLLIQNDGLLMVNHQSLTSGDFWAPPGGGINFGESATACLRREFLEETGLEIQTADFLFACEFIRQPLHAIELFFTVNGVKGVLVRGSDPEMKSDRQIIRKVQFLRWAEIQKISPSALHGIFHIVNEPSRITQLNGYLSL